MDAMTKIPIVLWGLAMLMASGSVGWAQHAPTPPSPVVTEGIVLFQQMCGACHGGEGQGGPGGAANLTRSALAQTADDGGTLRAFLRHGRPERGMPPYDLDLRQAALLSAALRSFAAQNSSAGAGPATVLVGDAETGRLYFNGDIGRCASCHTVNEGEASAASNLAHVASRYPSAKAMQNAMILNRSTFWSPALGADVAAEVTFGDGRVVSGYLTSVSDFKVVLRDATGTETEIARAGGVPRVTLHDRLQHHIDLLGIYRDEDIHNLTAYLATLR